MICEICRTRRLNKNTYRTVSGMIICKNDSKCFKTMHEGILKKAPKFALKFLVRK